MPKLRVEIEESELIHLREYHREQMYAAAEKQRYTDAEHHKRRGEELKRIHETATNRPDPV